MLILRVTQQHYYFCMPPPILFELPFPETGSDIVTYPRLCQVLAARNFSQLPVKVPCRRSQGAGLLF
jgi:hypothetical protein